MYKIKVLHVVSSLNRGGIETWLYNIVQQHDPRFEFDFLVQKNNCELDELIRECGSKVHYIPWSNKDIVLSAISGNARFLPVHHLLKNSQYDVVHVHKEVLMGEMIKNAALHRVPVRVAHKHSNQFRRGSSDFKSLFLKARFFTRDVRLIYKYATDIVACSDEAGRYYMKKNWDLDDRCRPLYCGINLAPFEELFVKRAMINSYLRDLFSIPCDAIVIGHVGNMTAGDPKNHYLILRIFKELYTRNKLYYLFLAGSGSEYYNLLRYAQSLGIADRVVMPGKYSAPELMVSLFDTFLFPSRFEGFGLVVIEAIASGLYVVASNVISRSITESVLRDRICLLPLNSSEVIWADNVENSLMKKKSANDGINIVGDSPFTIQSSLDQLYNLYSSRLLS